MTPRVRVPEILTDDLLFLRLDVLIAD
jgi:hypothetical protein